MNNSLESAIEHNGQQTEIPLWVKSIEHNVAVHSNAYTPNLLLVVEDMAGKQSKVYLEMTDPNLPSHRDPEYANSREAMLDLLTKSRDQRFSVSMGIEYSARRSMFVAKYLVDETVPEKENLSINPNNWYTGFGLPKTPDFARSWGDTIWAVAGDTLAKITNKTPITSKYQ